MARTATTTMAFLTIGGFMLVGCSSQEVTPADSTTSVTVQVAQPTSAATWTLTCDPVGGDHPDADEACAVLIENADALQAPPSDQMCTELYGGPDQARVTGSVQGRTVSATLSRSNGCEIDRWERLVGLLPASVGVTEPPTAYSPVPQAS